MELKTIYISYSRVSTNEQGEKGVSIEAQIEEHKAWAAQRGVEISQYFIDRGYSAGTFKRPGLQEMLRLLSENKKTSRGYSKSYVIIIRYQSRLIRDVSKKRSLQCVFEKFNTTVCCLNGIWMDKPEAGGIVSDIPMLFDENERKQVSGRVFDSYKHIALNGGYPIGGKTPPRGYTRVKSGKINRLVPNDDAPVVKEAFELLATGKYSPKAACELFNAKNLLNKRWNSNVLSRFIDNPIYYGRLKTSYFDSDDPSITEAQKAGWYNFDCHCQPIISRELFEQVQNVMHIKRKNSDHSYYFENKIKCNHCGGYLSKRCSWRIVKSTGDYTLYKYYYCPHCDKRINETYVLEQFLLDYPKWERETKNSNYLRMLQNKIISKQNQIEILNGLYEECVLDQEEYTTRLKLLSKDIKSFKNEYKKYIGERELDWNQFTSSEKAHFINSTIDCIYVFPGPISDGAEVTEIRYRESLPAIKKINKRK